MKLITIDILSVISLPLFSCGRECQKQNDELKDTLDLRTLRPLGDYYLNGDTKKEKVTFTSDSTAVYIYKHGDSTYEISYKVKKRGSSYNKQAKFLQ